MDVCYDVDMEEQSPLLAESEWDHPELRKARVESAWRQLDPGGLEEAFRAYLSRRVRHPENYLYVLRNLLAYLSSLGRSSAASLQAGDLEGFVQSWIEHGPPLSRRGSRTARGLSRMGGAPVVRTALAALRALAGMLEWGGVPFPQGLRFPKAKDYSPTRRPLLDKEVEALLQAARAHPVPAWRAELEAMLFLLLEGVRVGELSRLRADDLGAELQVRGRRNRKLPLSSSARAALARYLEEREALLELAPQPYPALFLRPRRSGGLPAGRPLSQAAVVEALHRLFALAEVPGPPGPRLLWGAVRRLLASGCSPAEVARRVALPTLPQILRGREI